MGTVITCAVAINNRRYDYNNSDNYPGLGYELLDAYILRTPSSKY